jgi:hypothetical protein
MATEETPCSETAMNDIEETPCPEPVMNLGLGIPGMEVDTPPSNPQGNGTEGHEDELVEFLTEVTEHWFFNNPEGKK